jgi:hypothetical protein
MEVAQSKKGDVLKTFKAASKEMSPRATLLDSNI